MYESILSCVPKKKMSMRKGSPYLNNPWFRAAVKLKRRLWFVYKNTPSNSTWSTYKQSLRKVTKLSIELRKSYEEKLSKSIKSPQCIKSFFSYAKHQGLDVHNKISILGDNGDVLSKAHSARIFFRILRICL